MFRFIFAASVLCFANAANAEILDFESIAEGPTSGFEISDYKFTSLGTMHIRTDSGSHALFSPIVWAPPQWSSALLTRIDGGAFDLLSLDVFAGDGNGLGIPLDVTARRADGTSFVVEVALPEFGPQAPIPQTKVTVNFGEQLFGIVSASWANGAEWHQIDNLSVRSGENGIVPEPATWALFISGFGITGVALRTRRGKNTKFA